MLAWHGGGPAGSNPGKAGLGMGTQIIPSLTTRHMKKPTLAVNRLCMSVVSGTNKKEDNSDFL